MDELGRKLRSRVFGVKLQTGPPPEYRPRENDDRSRLIMKSWLELEKKRSLVRSSPLKEDDEIAERRFYRTANVIAIVYDQIRSETEDVAIILENNDDCLCALFQLAYVVVSFNFCFDGIKAYEIILTQILDIASNPTFQNIQREGPFLSAAESVTKILDAAVCEDGELKNLCHKIFDVARDSDQASTIMARVSALKTLHNGTTILSKKRKFRKDAAAASTSSSIPPSLPSAVKEYVEQQLPQKSDLQQTTGDKHLSGKLKWILHILKHMSLQYKNHVFSPTLDFKNLETKTAEYDDGKLSDLENRDPKLFRLVMKGQCGHLDAETYELLLYMAAYARETKKDLRRRLKELSGKIDFCRTVYEESDVYEELGILYDKKRVLVSNLALDFTFCRYFFDKCLDIEIATTFKMLIEELELSDLEDDGSPGN